MRFSGAKSSYRVFLKDFDGVNTTVLRAGMWMISLVRGLRPLRAARRRTEKVPKPGKVKRFVRNVDREGQEGLTTE